MSWRLAALSVAVLAAQELPTPSVVEIVPQPAEGPSRVAPADPPTEFRVLQCQPLPLAPEALKDVWAEPAREGPRRQLAEIYTRNGYLGAARFFDDTVRELRREPPVTQPVQTGIAWSYTGRDRSPAGTRVAAEVARLVSDGEYDAAVQLAQAEVEASGPTARGAVQWAYAVVSKGTVAPSGISPEVSEAAVRLLLTSLLERVPLPAGVDCAASGFELLSTVFAGVGDNVSAVTAARLALRDVEDPGTPYPESDSGWRQVAAHRLREKIQLLELAENRSQR